MAVLGALALASCAHPQQKSLDKIDALTDKALTDYDNERPQEARRKLMQALAISKEKGLEDTEPTARARLALGRVYVGGLEQKSKGIEQMTIALETAPSLRLPSSEKRKAVRKAFAAAKKQAASGGTASSAEPAGASGRKARGGRSAEEPAVAAVTEEPAPARAPVSPPPERKRARETAASAEPASKSSDSEPDLPANIPQPLYCPGPDEVPPNTDVVISCVVRSSLERARLTLHYRPPSSETFVDAPMKRSPKGWHNATIPASAVTGKMVQFYVEAGNDGGKPLAVSGDAGSPNLVLIRSGAQAATGGVASRSADDDAPGKSAGADENPLDDLAREEAAASFQRTWWLSVGAGSGYGWHRESALEFNSGLSTGAGTTTTGNFHILPEVGVRFAPHWGASLQWRHQFIFEQGDPNDGLTGHPARGADLVLARGLWWPRMPGATFDPFLSAAIGSGSGFRFTIPPTGASGSPRLLRNDTVRGGPVALGAGLGALLHFGHWAVGVEARALAGVPDTALIGELAGNVQVEF